MDSQACSVSIVTPCLQEILSLDEATYAKADRALELIATQPNAWPVYEPDYDVKLPPIVLRWKMVRGTSLALFFRVSDDGASVVVYVLQDMRMDPEHFDFLADVPTDR
jgi:hypothetical protein